MAYGLKARDDIIYLLEYYVSCSKKKESNKSVYFLSQDVRRKTRVDKKLSFSFSKVPGLCLALARFKTRVRLINYVYTTFASNNSAISVSSFKRFQRICDFHNSSSKQ